MKSWLKIAVLAFVLGGLVAGCSKDKGNSSNHGYSCDAYGRCSNNYADPYGPYGNNGFGAHYNNPNAVILAGKINVTNTKMYQKYLHDIGTCFDNSFTGNTCGPIAGAPLQLQVLVDDYKFSSADKKSPGTISLVTGTGPATYRTAFRMIDNNAGFDTQVLGPIHTNSYDHLLKVRLTGRPTDSSLLAEVFYRGDNNKIGDGIVYRQNKPMNPKARPSNPRPTPYTNRPNNSYPYNSPRPY